jgi:predicted RNase H-like HicB family nuclease
MATIESDLQLCEPDSLDQYQQHRVFECRIWLCPEADGGFSVVAPFLPGVVSQGETESEAIENFREAFQGAAAEYLETEGSIPWSDSAIIEKPQDAIEKWILVHV